MRGWIGIVIGIAAAGWLAPGGCAPSPGTPITTTSTAPPWGESERAAAIADGRAVLDHHECTRCHAIDDVAAPSKPRGCASCHLWLDGLRPGDPTLERLNAKWGPELITRYQRNLEHFEHVPSLTGVGARVRPAYLAQFLRAPEDLRPGLTEAMLRHNLTDGEIDTVARYFAAVAGVPPAGPEPLLVPIRAADGERLFREKGCVACHRVGNVDTGVPLDVVLGNEIARSAPDLRFARDRMDPAVAVRWIVDPASVQPAATMPKLGVSPDDAAAIRDWLWTADPALEPVPTASTAVPPLLDRPVPWEEVEERVLGKVCVHCHMNDYEKDPGPGNEGGLGFAGVGLSMRTYETLVQGARGPDGAWYSVLQPRPGESVAPIVQSLLRRRTEGLRDQVVPGHDHARPAYDGARGMPLGLPAMSDEEIALLATWIAQGCVGPARVDGRPGVYDGLLVPEGPIAKNQGCEQRDPSAVRPAWAVDSVAPNVLPAGLP